MVVGTGHLDFSDFAAFKEQVDLSAVFPDGGVDGSNSLGPIHGARALTVVRRYLAAWFDHTLRGESEPLLRGQSRRFPEVEFQQKEDERRRPRRPSRTNFGRGHPAAQAR